MSVGFPDVLNGSMASSAPGAGFTVPTQYAFAVVQVRFSGPSDALIGGTVFGFGSSGVVSVVHSTSKGDFKGGETYNITLRAGEILTYSGCFIYSSGTSNNGNITKQNINGSNGIGATTLFYTALCHKAP